MASFVTAGLVAIVCYLFQVPLSRGFVFDTFLLGPPLLALERYLVRQTIQQPATDRADDAPGHRGGWALGHQ